ncbi:barstar family protein [Actinomadura hibisca]|uniref:barstar family protein n=1 Tax=Actinomadura hibisca TaxID=68565 RepID=UPI000833751D|nr:barstar family protein [Actinomadura hibisca]
MDADRALTGLLTGRLKPGLYQWRAPATAAAGWWERAAEEGWRSFDLDAGSVHDKEGFLRLCARVFDFPEYYGENWDALEDCLTDLSWAPARRGHLVVFRGWDGLAEADQASFRTALDVFAEAVESWRDTGTPMAVLLPTAGVEVAGIPRLG